METVDLDHFKGEQIHRLHADAFFRLHDIGAFEGERVELLDGLLVGMIDPDPPHVWIVARILERLILQTRDHAVTVLTQGPVTMSSVSVPQPDICVVPKQVGFKRPFGGILVVEVSDSSLKKDRDIKVPIYAKANVPEYWIVDINHDCVHVHTDPTEGSYRTVTVVTRDGALRPQQLPGVEISVNELLDPGA